ncbi:CPBP family intramembrane glutamic endopeptidase [Agromyces sp. MMS24-K17]|uniref:CPBP family intramembrane glutamic endopeptidase n=1 Tax=Agromyces sp. MMS24-K17 TaxID=3372850 RepID=UPI0037553E12
MGVVAPDAATTHDRVRRTFWVGLVAVGFYVLVAAGLGNLLGPLAPEGATWAEFALSHFIPLAIAIGAGLWFARWSGWWADVWTQPAAVATPPRRWWLLAVPVLLLVNPVVTLAGTPWGDRPAWWVLLVAVGCLGIGVGEELFYRGILRVSLRARHGELVTLLVTSLLFGLSHTVGSMIAGVEPGGIAFQVAVTSMNGALYYAAFKATGSLWVPIALHALDDCSLYLQSTAPIVVAAGHADTDPSPVTIVVQVVLAALSVAVVVSAALEDRRARRARKASAAAE